MSKHTKGPWKVLPAKADRVNGGEFFPVHAGNVWIADVRYNSANALLIAAAPDLLQELQNIANADYRHWEDGHNIAEAFVLWAKIRARHAISKAEEVKP